MKIKDRNWKGRLTPTNIIEMRDTMCAMFKEKAFVCSVLTISGSGDYDLRVTTGEDLKLTPVNDYGFSVNAQNYLYPISMESFIEIRHDRVIIQQTSAAKNHCHWEFVKEKGEQREPT